MDDVTRFDRAPHSVLLEVVAPLGGALTLFALAVWVTARSGDDQGFQFPLALVSIILAVPLLVTGVSALRRQLDPRAIEVDPEGVWLRAIGYLRWEEFSDIRLEEYTDVSRSTRATGRVRSRRLGFVPEDPRLADRYGVGVSAGLYKLLAHRAGLEPIDFAPFGVEERELGSDAFARLLDLVDTYRYLRIGTPEPGSVTHAPPSPLEVTACRDTGIGPDTPTTRRAAGFLHFWMFGLAGGLFLAIVTRLVLGLPSALVAPLIPTALVLVGVIAASAVLIGLGSSAPRPSLRSMAVATGTGLMAGALLGLLVSGP